MAESMETLPSFRTPTRHALCHHMRLSVHSLGCTQEQALRTSQTLAVKIQLTMLY